MLEPSGSVGFAQAGEVPVHGRWGMKATFAMLDFRLLTRDASQAPQIMNPKFSFSATERE